MAPAPIARDDASILHADLDAFYASVEQLDDPALRGRPVVVGGLGPRGVVAAASYEARRFGVHSAQPMARARRACPDGVFLPPRFERYGALSRTFLEVLRRFTPLVEPLALDEAFLDVHGARRSRGRGVEIAGEIRRDVRAQTGLAVSVGAATTKLMAKLASDLAKPDGFLVVEPGHELALLHPLPVDRLFGVGPATRAQLERLGLHSVGDLARAPAATLVAALGTNRAAQLQALAQNRDDRAVEPEHERKSLGHEETFPRDVADPDELARVVTRMADRVGTRLRAEHTAARTVQLKVRFADFRTITRSRTLPAPTDRGQLIGATARELLAAVDLAEGVRLVGVTAQKLSVGATDPSALFEAGSADARHAALEETVDALRARFGPDALLGAYRPRGEPEPE